MKKNADEGKMFTNGETFATVVYLGKNNSSLNWAEITQEEHNQIIRQQEDEI